MSDKEMYARFARLVEEPLTTAPRREREKRIAAEAAKQLENNRSARALFQKKQNESGGWEKSCKPNPFPKGLPAAKQYAAWIDWKKQLEVSLELMNATSQHIKASLLFLHAGEEIREIISAYGYMPDRASVQDNFKHYDNVVARLDKYFQEATDETIDLETLWAMKQEQNETARVFLTRLMRQTALCDLHDGKIVRTNLLRGMANKGIAKLAMANDWELEKIIKAATREEALVVGQQPLSMFGQPAPAIEVFQMNKMKDYEECNQVERSKRSSETFRANENSQRYKKPKFEPGRFTSRKRYDDVKPCPNCGIRFHRNGTCPAEGKSCLNCNKVGHFRRMCRISVNQVQKEKDDENEQDDLEVKFYN